MKLHEIKLLESAQDPENFKVFLEKHCTPYFQAADTTPLDTIVTNSPNLFRGISRTKLDVSLKDDDGKELLGVIKSVRSDRQPKDTHPQLSKIIDQCLYDKFGWKPRSEGVFCFGNSSIYATQDFGWPSVVFPIGNIKYIWNNEVTDLTIFIKRMLRKIKLLDLDLDEKYDQEDLDQFKKAFEEKILPGYKDTDLDQAIMSYAEIIIKCGSYLAIPL